jgi:hypothetical protein
VNIIGGEPVYSNCTVTPVEFCKTDLCMIKFRDFYQGLFTMFQVMTGESWFSVVTRSSEDRFPYFSFIFFTSFFVFASFILKNVLTGIILDAMSSSHDDEEKLEEETMEIKEKISKVQNSFALLRRRMNRIKLALANEKLEVKKEERVFQSDAEDDPNNMNQNLIETTDDQNLLSPQPEITEFKNVEEVENSPLISKDQNQNDLIDE